MFRRIEGRRIGIVAGIGIALGSLAGLVVPAFGQSAGGEPKEQPAAVQREAYFTAPANGALPATITSELPPGVLCILVPQACGSTTQPVTGPAGGVLRPVLTADIPDHLAPQPVETGTLPVGMLGGKPRYTSYLKVGLPDIPSGSIIDRFDLVLTQTELSFALESPAFRQAVLAGFVTYQNRTPDELRAFLGSVASQTTPLATNRPTGIELCAVSAPWAAGPSQDSSAQPPRDCIFGANGVFDPASRTWTFDLSLLAQAWLDGTTPNEGVYLGPVGAENLAFGDPDTSTNYQISLGGAGSDAPPRIRYAFSEGFGDDESFDLGDGLGLGDGSAAEDFGSIAGSVDSFAPAFDAGAAGDAGFGGATSFPAGGTGGRSGPGSGDAAGELAGGGRGGLQAQLAGQSRPQSPWWLWLLLPLGLGVAYAFSRSAEELPPVGHRRGGALTRLIESADGERRPGHTP